jgi:hypothetical protein
MKNTSPIQPPSPKPAVRQRIRKLPTPFEPTASAPSRARSDGDHAKQISIQGKAMARLYYAVGRKVLEDPYLPSLLAYHFNARLEDHEWFQEVTGRFGRLKAELDRLKGDAA